MLHERSMIILYFTISLRSQIRIVIRESRTGPSRPRAPLVPRFHFLLEILEMLKPRNVSLLHLGSRLKRLYVQIYSYLVHFGFTEQIFWSYFVPFDGQVRQA